MVQKEKSIILVVEDERALSFAIQKKLSLQGLDAVVVGSVADAKEVVEKNRVVAVWLDHYLIGKDSGLALVEFLKSKKEYKNIPVFVVSNTATQDKVNTYLKLGIEKYYVKAAHKIEEIVSDVKQTIV